ncbi:exported hypothetical protein [Mesorhizobium plurifarium]|uniref:Uncharacterized protein n=1 Tax=Mesorhizobium plurifarium TaxID=69974 RepID=A0A090G3U1_MESPL|nr:exported hypothetical protein [Mesorhizobium plurifarium]
MSFPTLVCGVFGRSCMMTEAAPAQTKGARPIVGLRELDFDQDELSPGPACDDLRTVCR